MAKCILMSIKPKYVSMILNKTKTIEVRKRFPSDYVGWVYIYCTKDRNNMLTKNASRTGYVAVMECIYPKHHIPYYKLNGKVVARFWCEKVEEINFHVSYNEHIRGYRLNNIYSTEKDLLKKSCLTQHELYSYLPHISPCGYAIHITNLEIFDKPKELRDFVPYCELCGSTSCCNCKHAQRDSELRFICCNKVKPLTRAPQSWQFIEV